jgi:glutamine phosphoribosylpyrophosphate amidotransferase
MCAVIGISIHDVTESDIELIKRIFLESRIRGKHATGVSYIKGDAIVTFSLPVPADEFIEQFDFRDTIHNGDINLIGHCRYSTSDLEYNQPIADGNKAIVHNGVISQELPENWEALYGIKCETKNDTELLLRTEGNPFAAWPNASISAIVLYPNELKVYRNGKRPLYETIVENGFILTSTKDIARRAGVQGIAKKVEYKGTDLQP